jgi:hypothetical protein
MRIGMPLARGIVRVERHQRRIVRSAATLREKNSRPRGKLRKLHSTPSVESVTRSPIRRPGDDRGEWLIVRASKSPLRITILGPSEHRCANGLFQNDFGFSGLHKLTQAPGLSVAVVHSGKSVAILCLAFNKEATNTGPSFDNSEPSILREYNHVF